MMLIIKGSITQIGEGEFSTDLVYLFQITPLKQDALGNDRVFTFNCYTKARYRNSPKHSAERKHIAQRLRQRHRNIWRLYHDAMRRT